VYKDGSLYIHIDLESKMEKHRAFAKPFFVWIFIGTNDTLLQLIPVTDADF